MKFDSAFSWLFPIFLYIQIMEAQAARITHLETQLNKELAKNQFLLQSHHKLEEAIRNKDAEIDRLTYMTGMMEARVKSTQKTLKKSSSVWSMKSYISSAADNPPIEQNGIPFYSTDTQLLVPKLFCRTNWNQSL